MALSICCLAMSLAAELSVVPMLRRRAGFVTPRSARCRGVSYVTRCFEDVKHGSRGENRSSQVIQRMGALFHAE